ncbi:MAG: 4Fe-4S dicluster domain-containing protein [Nitrospiraceae bacterium]|nr:4Fe-4S dicluster domain-containing protein [Nitrospiraceae bacterium]
MWNFLKDVWHLFGRLFPFPTKPGLRRIGDPDRSSPVLVTCNYELTVRKVIQTLVRDGVDAWLLVAPTKGINVWCAAGGGHFTTDTVVSILKTSGIDNHVDHRRLILPQLSARGVNFWGVKEHTGWKPRFGPADIKDLAAYLRAGKSRTEREHRRVKFVVKDRFVMGTNLGFNTVLLLILPLLISSIWLTGLWWKTLPLLFVLSVASSVGVFWLPGKVGVQKGVSLGVLAAAIFVVLSQTFWQLPPWPLLGWTGWIVVLSAYVGYDMPSWSPLWRQDPKELVLGVKQTQIEIIQEKCINCHLCDIVCPSDVFRHDPEAKKYEVANLDACQACGACIENCPTEAIVSNFRGGTCACPTCAIIDGVGALKRKTQKREVPTVEPVPAAANCDTEACQCALEDREPGIELQTPENENGIRFP